MNDIGLLPDLMAHYEAWEESHRDGKGGFCWQVDHRDGMEVSSTNPARSLLWPGIR